MLTVTVATPVTIEPSVFEKIAVIAVVPFARALTTPGEVIVATVGTLELQVDVLVRFTVVPVDVVPMAISPAV
jgi:archaellum biogenesis ATPase FlaH